MMVSTTARREVAGTRGEIVSHHTIRRDRSITVAISLAQTGSEWPRRTEVWPHLARLAALACSRLLSLQKRLVLRWRGPAAEKVLLRSSRDRFLHALAF